MSTDIVKVARASAIVRDWAHKNRPLNTTIPVPEQAPSHRLTIPGSYLSVTFTPSAMNPTLILIHCSNWKAEDEAHGVFDVQVARNFYRLLVMQGLRAF
jgi:hypothetical protein